MTPSTTKLNLTGFFINLLVQSLMVLTLQISTMDSDFLLMINDDNHSSEPFLKYSLASGIRLHLMSLILDTRNEMLLDQMASVSGL